MAARTACKHLLALAALAAGPLLAADVTHITVENPSDSAKTHAVVTFGLVFKAGDVPPGLSLQSSEGSLQVDPKATHPDGSLRHAVLTLDVGAMAAHAAKTVGLRIGGPPPGAPHQLSDLAATSFDAKVTVTLAGVAWTASVRDSLATGKGLRWLSGPLCDEWILALPLRNAGGSVHPQLHARFALRAYHDLKNIRADVTVENDWAFEPDPRGLTYDAAIEVGGTVYTKTGLAQTHHSRWRKVIWWGGDPTPEWAYDKNYLLSTGAFPRYEADLKIAPAAFTGMAAAFEPMAHGDLTGYMPETGAHDDIGPLPRFAALYLVTMDPRARRNVLANGECGGAYQIHYRNKATGRPVTLDEFPYMTLLGNESDTRNPVTGKLEAFPAVSNPLDSLTPDDAHQPSIAYLPYVISGDYFYLEELQFWANWNMILANPGYRENAKGLLKWGQNRAQAWSLRTLGQAASITPDAHPLKAYFTGKLGNNIAWYHARYVTRADSVNAIGYLESDYAYAPFGIAPWQDDFFTWSMGYLGQLGFAQVEPFLKWKARFVVARLTDPGYCWLRAPAYSLQVGTAAKVPYKTLAEIYHANYPDSAGGGVCSGVVMDGYPDAATGYGANMQPALAAAVDAGADKAQAAWEKYQTRAPKQDYSSSPQFDVVPSAASASVRPPAREVRLMPGAAPRLLMPGAPVTYVLPWPARVAVEAYGLGGRRLFIADLGLLEAGVHRFAWPGPHRGPTPCLIRIRTSPP